MRRKGIKLLSRIAHRIASASRTKCEPGSSAFYRYRDARTILRTLRSALKTQERIRLQMHNRGRR